MDSEIRGGVLYLSGDITVKTVDEAALRRLRRLLGQKPAKADLSAVGRADSACLCLLLEILRGSGGQLRGIPAAVRDLADLYEVREWMNL